MDLHRSHMRYQSRRGCNLLNMTVQILLLMGLWISNTIIGCEAMPHPKAQFANSINKIDAYEKNYAVANGAPLLIPMQEEVILDVDADFVMRCEDTEAIVWKCPTDAVTEEDTYTPDDQNRTFGRTLTVKMANHMSVGNYYCIKESSLKNRELMMMEDSALTDLANNNLASSIYVYVNDTENLLAPMPFPVIHVMQYQDVVIPCKPSMPNIEVLLTTPSGKDDDLLTISTSNVTYQEKSYPSVMVYDSISYRPYMGFIVQRLNTVSGDLNCVGQYRGNTTEMIFTIKVFHSILDEMSKLGKSGLTTKISPGSTLTATTTYTSTTTTVPVSFATSTTVISLVTNRNLVSVTNSSGPSVYNGHVPPPIYNVMDVGVGDVNLIIYKNGALKPANHSDNMGDGDNDVDNDDDDDDHHQHDDGDGDGYRSIAPRSTTPSGDEDYGSGYKIMADNDLSNSFEHQSKELAKSSSFFGYRRSARGVDTTTRRTNRVLSSLRSTPSSITKSVDQPTITSTTRNHAEVGETFQLVCEIKMAHDVKFKAEWIVPDGVDKARVTEVLQTNTKVTAHHTYYENILTVKNAQRSDSGKYSCNVTDHSGNRARNSYKMLILNMNETYIEMDEPNGYYELLVQANSVIQMMVRYNGYPQPTLDWYKPDGSKLMPGLHKKYDIENKDTSSTLKVLNAHLLDSGIYTVNASNGAESKIRQFIITVADKPIVVMEDVYVHAGQKAHLQCHVKSHKKPTVTWVFQPCSIQPRWPSCKNDVIRTFNDTTFRSGDNPLDFVYDLNFIPQSPGIIHCWAENNIDRTGAKAHVLIRDIEDNITVSGVNENDIIALGDEVTITCAAVAYYFANDLNWFDKDGEYVRESNNIKITSSTSAYSYKKSITFKHIQDSDQGAYECRASYVNNDTNADPKYVHITTHEPSSPQMTNTNLGDNLKLERKLGESLELTCESHAIPKATVTWYKDDIELANITSQYSGHMVIPYMRPEDQGHYKCVVANRLGVVEQTVNVKITNIPGLTLGWIAGILIILLILIVLVIYLCIRVKRERKLLRELKAAGLANFEEGAMEHINPALTLDEQADLLPYDRGFEFSRDKLKLGKQLGAGAFGVVLKAHAEGIKPGEKESVVAVKMVKRSANNEVMRALVSELKIMVHLGQHLNVVNLLGAVTKNIAKRELMVIVEYCRYGNVQNFLMRNRKRFINQIHPQTGRIDPSIMSQRFSDNFELDRSGLKYVNLSFSNHQYINHMNNINNMNNYYSMNNRRNSDNEPRSGTRAGRPGSTGYLSQSEYYEGQVNTCGTEQTVMTTVPEDEDNIMSNNSVQPAWRSNYKPDSTEAMTITTTDLISWSFQVACGMEYLSSKKVLHGDLAARNILLCEDNIVKICDFGLARSMYKSDNYKKQGDAPLPIKWLALESLSDHIFSTYTDVWSFGIVMWELFSLAKVPYPEIDANQSLYLKLKDGYRMEKPPYANDDLYDIMLECWSTNPERRPLFNVLKERFAMMLGEEVTSHYVDLNEPYLRVNTEYMKRNQTDYLALMGSPDEMAPPPPKYVNGHILPEIRIDLSSDDYLQMSPNGDSVIFSPTRPKDSPKVTDDSADQPPNISTTSFNFPDNAAEQHSPTLANNLDSPVGKPPRNKKDGIEPLPEEIPMLHNAGAMEGSPHQPRKYAQILQQTRNVPTPSPRHHIAETKLAAEDDNYVNVKSPKNALNNNGSKAAEAFSNPSYQILKTAAEKGDPN